MGSSDEQFCLRWNDFQHCIKSTFQSLREDAEFMDVTLSCDGEQIKAHKVILSACSVTFKNLLKKNPSPHPVFVLWDIDARDLSAILDFMYNGEVNVQQENLNSFLSVAERLRVRGLCQHEDLKEDKSCKDGVPPPPVPITAPTAVAPKTLTQTHTHSSKSKSSRSLLRNSIDASSSSTVALSTANDVSAAVGGPPANKRAKLNSCLPAPIPITEDANHHDLDDIEEIQEVKHELDATQSFADRVAGVGVAATVAAAVAAAAANAGSTGLMVKDLSALQNLQNAASAVGGVQDQPDDYGDYYEDEAGFGGVDPVDQSQAGKERSAVPSPRHHEDISQWASTPQDGSLRQRTVFSSQQILELEKEFRFCNFVQVDRRVALAGQLGLTERQIKIWFQNRRMKQKREEKEGFDFTT